MQLKRFIDDDDAVSPVIGVILMVAITVILAAVIATFVLGLGDQISDTGPTASFDFDYDGDNLSVTHANGNVIDAGNLYLRGSNAGDVYDGSWADIELADGSDSPYGDSSEIRSGSSITIDVDSGDTVRVVWESSEGGQSSTLETWRGPDA